MNKKFFWILLLLLFLIFLLYLQFGREITVCNSLNRSSSNQQELELNIIANRLYIGNETAYARKILKRTQDNKLPQIKLSYPHTDKYVIHIYLDNQDWTDDNTAFTIIYISRLDKLIIAI